MIGQNEHDAYKEKECYNNYSQFKVPIVLPNKKYAIIISKRKGNHVDYLQLISFLHDIFLIDNTSPFDNVLL
jgi:hypothetical protein